jgi:hypothetical protein
VIDVEQRALRASKQRLAGAAGSLQQRCHVGDHRLDGRSERQRRVERLPIEDRLALAQYCVSRSLWYSSTRSSFAAKRSG